MVGKNTKQNSIELPAWINKNYKAYELGAVETISADRIIKIEDSIEAASERLFNIGVVVTAVFIILTVWLIVNEFMTSQLIFR